MDRKKFNAAAETLQKHIDVIQRERDYKTVGAPKVREHLQAFLDRTLQGRVDVLCNDALDLLGWRLQMPMNELAVVAPDEFRAALTALWSPPPRAEHADDFWRILEPVLDRLTSDNSQGLKGVNPRTTVATYLLYVADPARFPFYMPTYGGKFITHVYGKDKNERLNDSSPGLLANAYTKRCVYLLEQFRDTGLELEDMMDLHSAIHIFARDYLKPGNT
ncbi:hypothetical protein Q0M94_26345 (plasmid) [Deinococcus radiomollis]|uniref:hypothetical protein n=1 Tax=Deinococcus radiomollis TaxID=468916 RepID=UPI0038927942